MVVAHFLAPEGLSGVVDRACVVRGLPDIDPDPHGEVISHQLAPVVAGGARGRLRHQNPKQRPFASALNQRPERPER